MEQQVQHGQGKPIVDRGKAAVREPWWTDGWLFGLLLVVATIIVYVPGIGGKFVWDDDAWTTKVAGLLRDTSGLWKMWCAPGALQQYSPLTGTTFWIDYHLWGFERPLPYHVENVLLHAGAVLLFWRLLRRLEVPGAWLAAAIFAVHPVMVESVEWIAERKNVLSMVLFLGTLLSYGRFTNFWTGEGERADSPASRKAEGGWYWGLALLLMFAALLAKASTICLPAVLLVICWWKRGRIHWRRDIMPTLPFFALAIGLGLATVWVETNSLGAKGAEWSLSWPQRLLNAGRAPWFYVAKLAWPTSLTFIYPRWELEPRMWWQWLYPIGAVGVLLWLWLACGRIGRGPAAAMFYFTGALFPVMGFFNIYFMRYSFVSDHWTYIPSLGLIALSAALVTRGAAHFRNPILLYGFAAAVLPLLGVLTWGQSGMYTDPETLFNTTLARNPRCAMACNNLGMIRLRQGQADEAKAYFERALEIEPKHASAHNNLGLLLLQQRQFGRAKAHFETALAADPGYANAESNLGMLYLQQDDLVQARVHFERAVQMLPTLADARLNLANVLLRQGEAKAAVEHLQKLLQTQPNNPYALINLALALATAADATVRNGAKAVEAAERADNLVKGRLPMGRATLAAAYAEAGRFPEAIATAQPVLQWATAQGDTATAELLQTQLKLYQAGSPYHQASSTNASRGTNP
jgi:Tfp pilus assembly protein PilF